MGEYLFLAIIINLVYVKMFEIYYGKTSFSWRKSKFEISNTTILFILLIITARALYLNSKIPIIMLIFIYSIYLIKQLNFFIKEIYTIESKSKRLEREEKLKDLEIELINDGYITIYGSINFKCNNEDIKCNKHYKALFYSKDDVNWYFISVNLIERYRTEKIYYRYGILEKLNILREYGYRKDISLEIAKSIEGCNCINKENIKNFMMDS